jgi:hypothetical protein
MVGAQRKSGWEVVGTKETQIGQRIDSKESRGGDQRIDKVEVQVGRIPAHRGMGFQLIS